jgi:Tfp pilus assembly protein PilN
VINKLNLSSYPFRNRILPWLFSALILFTSVVAAVFLYANWANTKTEADVVRASTQTIEDEMKKYQVEEENVRQSLSPDQQQLLIAAHKLVLRKQFSWSRLFSDLENLLPGGISVSQINVTDVERRNDRTEADIEFGVLSYRYENVIQMIDNLNSSGLFHAELRGQDRQKSDGGDYTEYTLHLVYVPHYFVTPQQAEPGAESASNLTPGVTQ